MELRVWLQSWGEAFDPADREFDFFFDDGVGTAGEDDFVGADGEAGFFVISEAGEGCAHGVVEVYICCAGAV